MTSSTPGKTMLINHFLVNDEWMIVDLPGYGYAKRSKADRIRLEGIISDYILNRQQMTNLFVLIDSRHKPQKSTLNSWNGLAKTESHSALFSQNLTNSAHRPEKTDRLLSGTAIGTMGRTPSCIQDIQRGQAWEIRTSGLHRGNEQTSIGDIRTH